MQAMNVLVELNKNYGNNPTHAFVKVGLLLLLLCPKLIDMAYFFFWDALL